MGNVAPVIVRKDGEPVLVTGGAGGAQIYPAVYQVITNIIDFHKSLQQALEAPRIGGDLTTVLWNAAADSVPPWFGGAPQFPQDTLNALIAIGDPVAAAQPYPWVGGTQSIAVDPQTYSLTAAADPRGLPAVGAPTIIEPQ
jgi:gamma-glutamyltranspeptidase